MIIIRKGAGKALKNTQNRSLQEELQAYQLSNKELDEVGIHQSFEWIRPEHMEPGGEIELPKIRELLDEQLVEIFAILDKLKNGEGVLHKTSMSVNGIGKLDVYQYIYFLAKHAERHITQMEKIKTEYDEAI